MWKYDCMCRCRKLPKGLKEWPAFNTLKKTIDDFNDMCPLLELMSNKAMKPRHWQRIAEVISRPLEVDSENFCLRNIMDTPLLQFKEDIEASQKKIRVQHNITGAILSSCFPCNESMIY